MNPKPDISKATARPWGINKQSIDEKWTIVVGADGSIVANVNGESGPDLAPLVTQKQPRSANAALIVKAVNEYEALNVVAAAAEELCQNIFERGIHDNWKQVNRALSALDTLRKSSMDRKEEK